MPPPILVPPYFPSAPAPITPTTNFYPSLQDDTSTTARKQYPEITSEVSDHRWTAPFRDGLPTPPGDMNGVAYKSLPLANYGGKHNGIILPPYIKAPRYPRSDYESSSATIPSIKSHSQPSSQDAPVSEPVSQKKSSPASYLQIPSSINKSKGSLSEFAAQMTCLFWFESTSKLKTIEERLNVVPSLVPEAFPTAGFKKWVTNILSTTQVSQNVILLALLFIYRLKKFNPAVRGKKGSEFRLMTIALMLGNKFLDDNTYTNKTWAEVSGIPVQEIHVMEVEFLSNVRYNLYVSEEEWAQWHTKLGVFSDFFNRASVIPEETDLSPTTPLLRISPTLRPTPQLSSSTPSKLPSPPASDSMRLQPTWNLPTNGPSYTSLPQLGTDIQLANPRKRTREGPTEDHPAKRMAMPQIIPPTTTLPPSSTLTSIPSLPPVVTPTSAPAYQPFIPGPVSHLPRPNLPTSSHNLVPTISTSTPQIPSAGRAIPSSAPYTSSTNWAAHVSQVSHAPAVPPVTSGVYTTPISLPDPARYHSSPYGVSSVTVSPAVSAYSVHTPQTHLSPSFFLANRNSPYRPVRAVNTLLIPPPSTSLQQQRSVPFDHMHYQPLGKTAAERRTGPVPYLHHEAWPQGPFVQPNFHPTPNYSI
ncbi:putative mucin [Aspergillus clavatus NRRL 1]|uniref:Mucin, putative n=1 Tax=Aspergillus clavatus (strain ATCC 1007 / CBS 513.65 / DSM 816 / NCTC 3887 / NRRL 1 / QM 1276 / 107) TaxID=344612 RepID=A1CPT0_ASPCL|nr:mucin, putative [Aspergillus clavatus NRRL 1]EAW07651.1 mucin, putative [Aspergillus clavatus NRRL 1]